jgi:two-component system LytT family sensor kinase
MDGLLQPLKLIILISSDKMLKVLYSRYQYFFNMLAVLILLLTTRMFDSIAWMPPVPGKKEVIKANFLYEFMVLLPMVLLIIYSYRLAIKRRLTILLLSFIIVFTVFGPGVVLFASRWLEHTFWRKDIDNVTLVEIEKYTPGTSLIFLFLSATYYITYLMFQAARQRETANRAETLAKDVQLKMLRYQINPHFLFNVLNSIYTLIDENTEKAKKLVIDMSEYYRYTLNKQQDTVSIEKEVESIMKYLEIQKTRFEEDFQYEISVDDAVKSLLIPSFLIHLLIENAIKFGTKTEKQTLIVNLSIRIENKMLSIKVSNTGKLLIATPDGEKNVDGTGNGIENLKNRLSLYYNDNYSFSLKEENGWVIAAIIINYFNAR